MVFHGSISSPMDETHSTRQALARIALLRLETQKWRFHYASRDVVRTFHFVHNYMPHQFMRCVRFDATSRLVCASRLYLFISSHAARTRWVHEQKSQLALTVHRFYCRWNEMSRSAQRIRTIKISTDTLPRAHTNTVRTDLSILIILKSYSSVEEPSSDKKESKVAAECAIYDRLSNRIRHISCDTHSWATVHTQRRVRKWHMVVLHEGYQRRVSRSRKINWYLH